MWWQRPETGDVLVSGGKGVACFLLPVFPGVPRTQEWAEFAVVAQSHVDFVRQRVAIRREPAPGESPTKAFNASCAGPRVGMSMVVSISTGACRCARLARMRSLRAEAFTRVIDAVFACNGGFLAAGDALTEPLGLTAAQWQVL